MSRTGAASSQDSTRASQRTSGGQESRRDRSGRDGNTQEERTPLPCDQENPVAQPFLERLAELRAGAAGPRSRSRVSDGESKAASGTRREVSDRMREVLHGRRRREDSPRGRAGDRSSEGHASTRRRSWTDDNTSDKRYKNLPLDPRRGVSAGASQTYPCWTTPRRSNEQWRTVPHSRPGSCVIVEDRFPR